MKQTLGIDIGGSHITLAMVDTINRELQEGKFLRKSVNSLESSEHILSSWAAAITELAHDVPEKDLLIGIAMPGPFDYPNGISLMLQGKFIHLYQINIKKELAERLSLSENQIYFINDAAAFLEGEVFSGCARGYQRVFGITLGTGLGSTFYNEGEASDEDLWDKPYRDSIYEEYLTTQWFVKSFEVRTGKKITGTKDLIDQPENLRTDIFDEYADSLTHFITHQVAQYQPEILVLGGNIAKAYPYFEERFIAGLKENNIKIPVKLAEIFEDAAILGAVSFAVKKSDLI